MSQFEIIDTGIVYRNPQPHLRSLHAYFPTAVELHSGELLVAFDMGSAFEALDVRSYCSRSSDGGKTWSAPEQIFEPSANHPVSTTCRVGAVDDGELLAWGCLFDRTRVDEGIGNPRTNGFCRTEFVTLRSVNGGRSWSPPQAVALPAEWQGFEPCAPPFSLGGDRLLIVTSPLTDWEGNASPWGHDGLAFGSHDRGRTWSEVVHTFQNGLLPITAFEQSVTRLSDGRFLAACWTYDLAARANKNIRVAISEDGHAFGSPVDTPLRGETCRLLGLEDNCVLAIYRGLDKPGLWAEVARIDRERWVYSQEVLLWQGESLGRLRSQSFGEIENMSTLKFGCPAVLRQRRGDIFVVFWCVEDCVSIIRWIRLRCAK